MKNRLDRIPKYPAPLRIGIFLLVLLGLWLPVVGLAEWLIQDTNTTSIVTLVALYGEFILLVRWWATSLYQQPTPFRSYGLVNTRRNGLNLLWGLGLGLSSLMLMFWVQGVLGWVEWQFSPLLARMILEGSLTGLGFGFAEELLFRGWLLDELQRDYSSGKARWINAIVFAALHAPRSIAQLPALVILGVALIWAKEATQGRLGLSIGLHGGLVWGYYIVNVGQLIRYADQVPQWVTGLEGNPLAGVAGLLAVGTIALGMKRAAIRQTDLKKQI
ncbi:MAG: CPBP family intramembrane metalloprotease [Leptolyngbyaceae cyanobacterium CSU_1_3]|nr:CPBP family intramembrane metalloprotease [Leptolyngbyaceae cyanobacterium CSU_1_3]